MQLKVQKKEEIQTIKKIQEVHFKKRREVGLKTVTNKGK